MIFKNNSGQALAELLVGIVIGAIIIGGAVTTIVLSLRSGLQNRSIQAATTLGQELVDNVTVYAEGAWRNIYELAKGASNTYYLAASGETFATSSGSQYLTLDNVLYQRYFYAENVCRDSGDEIVTCGTEDPSTQKITVNVNWFQQGATSTVSLVKYITRSRNLIFRQTDWSGGDGQTGPISEVNNAFDTHYNINATGTPGSIKIIGF